MLILGTAISLIGLIAAYEVFRQIRITRRIEADRASGLSLTQLRARGRRI